MDTTDPEIQFDEEGVCSHCRLYNDAKKKFLHDEKSAPGKLRQLIDEIKKSGKGKPYDCVIGVSGGIDSTYVAYKVHELGLRALAVHLDNGWDSELAVKNIENILKKLDIELHTVVLDWDEFKNLQVAFLKASVPDAEVPTDHAIMASLYHAAVENGLRYIISGSNFRTEFTMPRRWSHGHLDWRYIKSIHNRFGAGKLRSYPHTSLADFITYKWIKKIKIIRLLDYVPYVKDEIMQQMSSELGWKSYGAKHYESVYTRFFQGYMLPVKFNFDKRKAHFSTLITSGQMTRQEALEELRKPVYFNETLRDDLVFVPKKLGLEAQEFECLMQLPAKTFWHYPSYENFFIFRALRVPYRMVKRFLRRGIA